MLTYIPLALALIFSFLYSATETGFYCLNRIRLRYRQERGWWTAKTISRLLDDPQGLLCTILIGNNIANYAATAAFTYTVEKNLPHLKAELVTTLILAPFLMIFCEIIPKSIAQRQADSLLYKVVPATQVSSMLFYPLVILLKGISKLPQLFLKGVEVKESPFFHPQRLSLLLEEGTEGGAVSLYQNMMARNIMALGNIPVKKVMIPLEVVTMAPDTVGPETLKDLAREKKFSRVPIYERDRSKVVGIVTLLDFLREGKDEVRSFVRPTTYLEADLPVDDALLRLRRAKQRMGIVTDGDGRAVGIVTIKDLVEEIVGELSVW